MVKLMEDIEYLFKLAITLGVKAEILFAFDRNFESQLLEDEMLDILYNTVRRIPRYQRKGKKLIGVLNHNGGVDIIKVL